MDGCNSRSGELSPASGNPRRFQATQEQIFAPMLDTVGIQFLCPVVSCKFVPIQGCPPDGRVVGTNCQRRAFQNRRFSGILRRVRPARGSDIAMILVYLAASLLLGAVFAPWLYSAGKGLAEITAGKQTNAFMESHRQCAATFHRCGLRERSGIPRRVAGDF